jgi:glycosyltransferase involved in cell wall biosynthesis
VEKPLASVVVSAYNRPDMLRSALASVIGQTYSELEIIVQDDSTNEACLEVVLEFNDSRIRYTHNSPSLGTAANLLDGYRKATGTYFSTLNDDDLYGPTYIDFMVRQLEAYPNATIAFSDHFVINGAGKVLLELTDRNSRYWHRDRLREGLITPAFDVALVHKSIPAMLAVFRRSTIDLEDFPDDVSAGYDYWLSYLAVRSGAPIFYTPQRLTSYRTHNESQTAGFADPAKRLTFTRYSQYIHTRILDDERLKSIHSTIRSRLARDYSAAGVALLRLGRNAEAAQELKQSLRTMPRLSAFAALLLCAVPPQVARYAFRAG